MVINNAHGSEQHQSSRTPFPSLSFGTTGRSGSSNICQTDDRFGLDYTPDETVRADENTHALARLILPDQSPTSPTFRQAQDGC